MVSSEGIARIMSYRALIAQLYFLTLPKVRHRWKRVVEELSNERWERVACEAEKDSS